MEKAKLIATICVKAAKDHVDYCGGGTRIYTIQDSPPYRIRLIQEAEIQATEDYTDDLLGVIRNLIEFLDIGPDAESDTQMLEIVIDGFKESMERLRVKRKAIKELARKLEEKRRLMDTKRRGQQEP